LNRQIVNAGLLERRAAYYAVRLSVVTAIYAGSWVLFFLIGSSWWNIAVAGLLGLVFSQAALLAHDVAHRQMFRTKKPSAIAGRIAANVAVGMSYGWWMDKHTRHHNNPNHDDLDPDVQPELLIWATESAWGRRGVKGFINRHQAGLFFPLLTLLSIDLPAQAGADLPQRRRWLAHRRRPGRTELPDRASPVPRDAHPNLPKAQPIIKAYCEQAGISYEETDLITAATP
jgi:hypothetical protein